MPTLLHASDLHFGPYHDAQAGQALLESIRTLSPDLLVFSGDFTQRAKVREYRDAREYLESLPAIPRVMIPGNHDVPLYRVWERLRYPRRNYREHISRELDSVTAIPGVTVVALDTTSPYRAIVNGRIRDRQLLFAARSFQGAPREDLRVLVIHHHLAPAPDYEADHVLPASRRYLDAFRAMEVDLILGGHLHRSYVANSLDLVPTDDDGPGIVIAHVGTTTSRRGRARERNKNSFNLIAVSQDEVVIRNHVLDRDEGRFFPLGTHIFPRITPKKSPPGSGLMHPAPPGGTPEP